MFLFFFLLMSNGCTRNLIKAGQKVAIIKKEDQRTGQLTIGLVQDILTNSAQHYRGIKVRLKSGAVGRISRIIDDQPERESNIGIERTVATRSEEVSNFISSKQGKEGKLGRPSNQNDKRPAINLSDFIISNQKTAVFSNQSWSCQFCTYINGPFSNICEMCNKKIS
jgi:uncharacterized repeat protein (TIGR03833 family)